MKRLGVNVDHVATLRQQRGTVYPDVVKAALLCEQYGASGIVCHLREDRRHINEKDVANLRKHITTHLNLEMSLAPEIVRIALKIRPDEVTLVPERRQELTTEGGLDVVGNVKRLARLIKDFHAHHIAVSLFIDPEKRQLDAAVDVGAKIIELHTGTYAEQTSAVKVRQAYTQLRQAACYAKTVGLSVSAGHGLHYGNTKPLLSIKEIEEYNIGHSIVAYAVFVGIGRAVKEMKALLR